MKRISGVLLAAVLLLAPEIATAKDFCMEVNSVAEIVFKNFSPPAKGTCKFIVEINPAIPGVMASGGACTTSDGSELLYSLTDGFSDAIVTLQGSTTLADGTGILSQCIAGDSSTTACDSFPSAVVLCPKKPFPITGSSILRTSQRSQFRR
jgi:hypothetical protein